MSELDIGDELPTLTVDLGRDFVAAYARGAGIGAGRFTDDEGARAEGLPGQICPGNLSLSLIARALLHGRPGLRLKRLGTTFRGLALAGQTVRIHGTVTERREDDGGATTLECDVWMEGAEGDRLVVGTATLEIAPP